MGEKVGDNKLRFAFLFTDAYLYGFTVAFDDNTVKSKRDCNPLILFDAAVVVSFEVSQFAVFIKGSRFKVKTMAMRGLTAVSYLNNNIGGILP